MNVRPVNATGYSGYWNSETGTYTPMFTRNSGLRDIAITLARPGNRRIRSVMRALNGVAPGAATSQNVTRIAAGDSRQLGGVRQIETVVVAETTTTAMKDEINARIYDDVTKTQPYAVDKSGNGGAGKVGY